MQVIGVDEVGKGAIAGPLVAVAYIRTGKKVKGVTDSKKLTKRQREALYPQLVKNGFHIESWVDNKQIDKKGINWANQHAFKGAVNGLISLYEPSLDPERCEIQVDGENRIRGLWRPFKQKAIFKGDTKVHEIACASIIAKVERDRWMAGIRYGGGKRPNLLQFKGRYGWESNCGYGTKEHKEAIKKYGLTDLHRRTFCG